MLWRPTNVQFRCCHWDPMLFWPKVRSIDFAVGSPWEHLHVNWTLVGLHNITFSDSKDPNKNILERKSILLVEVLNFLNKPLFKLANRLCHMKLVTLKSLTFFAGPVCMQWWGGFDVDPSWPAPWQRQYYFTEPSGFMGYGDLWGFIWSWLYVNRQWKLININNIAWIANPSMDLL